MLNPASVGIKIDICDDVIIAKEGRLKPYYNSKIDRNMPG